MHGVAVLSRGFNSWTGILTLDVQG